MKNGELRNTAADLEITLESVWRFEHKFFYIGSVGTKMSLCINDILKQIWKGIGYNVRPHNLQEENGWQSCSNQILQLINPLFKLIMGRNQFAQGL